MLSEMSGAGPVLLALTGNSDVELLGRVNWKKVRKKLGKAAKVGAWVAAPGVMATITAAKAAKAALKRKQAKNIENLKIERANRARKLAEARKRQAEAEKAERAARTDEQRAAAAEQKQRAAESVQAAEEQASAPVETVDETADSPADESEEIQDNGEPGAEESVETMGYSRSNDDYFVGASTLQSAAKKVASSSGQLKIVKGQTSHKTLYIVGGVALAAYLFRKQLAKAVRG